MTSRKCRPLRVGSRLVAIVGVLMMLDLRAHADEFAAPLPEGVKAVWDLDQGHRETTPTRERICINGLWRWQPAGPRPNSRPTKGWGYFKVPGCWPGITDYMQKDSQTLYPHPELEGRQAGRPDRGLVRARDRQSPAVGRPPHRRVRRVPELLCGRVRRRQAGRRDPVSRRRGGPDAGLPARRQAPAQPARRGLAAEGRHALVQRHRLGPAGQGHGAPARPVRRRLPRRHAGRRRGSPT